MKWTGWPSETEFPDRPSEVICQTLDKAWESDGFRRLETNWTKQIIQFTFSVKPSVNPILFCQRVKGRLDHTLRHHKMGIKFSRKVGFRTIGNNRREEVLNYINQQVAKEEFVDSRFAELIQEFTFSDDEIRLQEPTETTRARYWHNLHLVLVTAGRSRFTNRESLSKLSHQCTAIARKKECKIASRSIMPDHIHLALRGALDLSPAEIALTFMNNLAFAFGQNAIWTPSYYVGSFGEYDMGAVSESRSTPP